MDHPIITVKNIGKRYNITHQKGGYIALRDVIAGVFKSPFKFLKTKALQISGREKKEDFWALKDINFTVEKGEVIGIIGRNGAGKSTLLKILSQITPPTEGEIRIDGRVGSLLEVGTGFHPELTGRENIFLNGAILGMTKKEIVKKFDEIVSFAGIEKFLDTPVKHYSSGMYVRLAFSVAAHMEPDVLIVDEVLAVGDAEFQKKCLGKMQDITANEGRTILFVSHNLGAIVGLCKKTIFLKDGKIKEFGDTSSVITKYMQEQAGTIASLKPNLNKDIAFTKVWITDSDDKTADPIDVKNDFKVWTEFKVKKEITDAEISVGLKNSNGVNMIFSSLSESNNGAFVRLTPGTYTTSTCFKGNLLMPSLYSVTVNAHVRGQKDIDYNPDVLGFTIVDTGNTPMSPYGGAGIGLSAILSNNKWEIKTH